MNFLETWFNEAFSTIAIMSAFLEYWLKILMSFFQVKNTYNEWWFSYKYKKCQFSFASSDLVIDLTTSWRHDLDIVLIGALNQWLQWLMSKIEER